MFLNDAAYILFDDAAYCLTGTASLVQILPRPDLRVGTSNPLAVTCSLIDDFLNKFGAAPEIDFVLTRAVIGYE